MTCVQVEESCESRGIRVAVPIPVPALTRASRIGALVYIDPLIYVRRFFYGAHAWALSINTPLGLARHSLTLSTAPRARVWARVVLACCVWRMYKRQAHQQAQIIVE